jgi:hypothetical protein
MSTSILQDDVGSPKVSNWKMEARAIRKEKRNLRDLDTSYIVLWKVRIS